MAALEIRALDSRLSTKLANREPTDVIVGPGMTVRDGVAQIARNVGSNKLVRLTLLMHGYVVEMEGNACITYQMSIPFPNQDPRLRVTRPGPPVSKEYGGYGLQWGKDDLDLDTVSAFSHLKGRFEDNGLICIFGCAAAGSSPNFGMIAGLKMYGDGPRLMRQLAFYSGARVRAAETIQQVVYPSAFSDHVDRTKWVGRTFLFLPNGTQVDESQIPFTPS